MIAWIALGLSLVSTALLVWDRFLRQSRFEVKADWVLTTASDPMLRVVIYNVGHRKDSVRDVRFKQHDMPLGRGWTPYESVLSRLPIVLDVDEASPAFILRPRSDPPSGLTDGLLTGLINAAEVENARSRISTHTLPLLFDAQANARTNSGPDLAKTIR